MENFVFRIACPKRIFGLQRSNRMYLMRAPYGRGRRFRQSQIADLSRPHQFRHSANRFFDRHLRIDAMLVVQIDGSYPQTLQAEEHTSELQSRRDLVCRLLLEKKKQHTTTE